MAYSETRIVIGGLAHVPVLIFIANFIKGKLGIKTEEAKDNVVKEELVKNYWGIRIPQLKKEKQKL